MDRDTTATTVNCPFLKKQQVDLTFKNITYDVKKFKWEKPFFETKQILHGVSGEFRSGELTAIMGPSGAGKSTLLNILAGYKMKGVKGNIYVNNEERSKSDPHSFKRISSYILQDDHLRDNLTVHEAMTMATELKLGRKVSAKQKQAQIKELLELLGLGHCLKTATGMLSGGQRKRLSIAFELITNPPIIFLDEPTTYVMFETGHLNSKKAKDIQTDLGLKEIQVGLDSSSCSQCVSLLKVLAKQGRTVACTIHQPSALIFETFTKVYALANGYCIYDGPTTDVVPYLSEKGLKCPVYHNPADFLLEVAVGEYGNVLDRLIIKPAANTNPSQADDKGSRSNKFHLKNLKISDIKHCIKHQTTKEDFVKSYTKDRNKGLRNYWPNNFFFQFYCLYSTNIILFQKAYKYRLTQFFAHFLSAVLLGCLFIGTGNDASMAISNITFVFGVLIFVTFTGKMSVTTTIPNELNILKVEHFNRWYSLLPYYLSVIIIEIPMQVFNVLLAVPVVYYMSNQPPDMFRFTFFQIFCISTSLTAQSVGFFMGSWAPVKMAVFVGPIAGAVVSALGFTTKFDDRNLFIQWCSLLSYFRSAFYSIMSVLYGHDRGLLDCNELYCHFRSPTKVLDELGMQHINIYYNLLYMLSVTVILHILTFLVLYVRLNRR